MDEPSALHTIVDTIGHMLKSIVSLNWTRYLSYAAALVTLPLRIAWIPISYLVALLARLFAPVGYILAYLGAWVSSIASFLVSLEPLYTFFSVAAFVGVLAGVLMAVASAIVTTYFNMQDEPEDVTAQQRRELTHMKQMYLQRQYLRRDQGMEPEWHWADTAASGARHRRVSGLQAETIHEEDDSEE